MRRRSVLPENFAEAALFLPPDPAPMVVEYQLFPNFNKHLRAPAALLREAIIFHGVDEGLFPAPPGPARPRGILPGFPPMDGPVGPGGYIPGKGLNLDG